MYNNKDNSIKGSSLSGSISHSLSEQDFTDLSRRTAPNGLAAAYSTVPTDSPPSSKASDDAYGDIVLDMDIDEKNELSTRV